MKQYNPIKLYINMPVEYSVEDSRHLETGHFAGYDSDGYPYVFEQGGTSYTRTAEQIVKVKFVIPMSDKSQGVYRTNKFTQMYDINDTNVIDNKLRVD